MKVLVALAVCLAVAQAATTNFFQPVSFQPTVNVPVPINPLLPAPEVSVVPIPEGTIYHEINVPHYDGAPLVIIKVNVQRVAQPESVPEPEPEVVYQNLPAIIPPEFFLQAPVFNPADLAKPTAALVFNPAELVKPAEVFNPSELVKPTEVFNPSELVKPIEIFSPADLTKPLLEEPIIIPEIQSGPLVKIIVNVEN